MLKHTGRHNDRKVVILFRQVPEENHMCLLVYSDVLSRLLHDSIMKCLEGPVGQQEDTFANALHRTLMPDGRNVLEVLHKEGFIKKVQTSQIIMTPTPSSSIRLDELNTLLDEMAKGDAATKRLAEADAQSGLTRKKNNVVQQREVGEPIGKNNIKNKPYRPALQAGMDGVLSDADIAREQLVQAERMENESKSLLAEAVRLRKEAAKLNTNIVEALVQNDTTEETAQAEV